MSRRAAVLALGVLIASACGGISPAPEAQHMTISSLRASFTLPDYSTHYQVDIDSNGTNLVATWTLKLDLVDPAGAVDPNVSNAKAALDTKCDNDGLGVSSPYVDPTAAQEHASRFVWTHAGVPGAAGYQGVPIGSAALKYKKYRCDHAKSGPHGHQGVVKVVVGDGVWRCTASYRGSVSGDSESAGQPGPSECATT